MAYVQRKGIEESVFHTISFMVEEVEVVQSRNANNFCALPVTWAGCLLCGWVGTRHKARGRDHWDGASSQQTNVSKLC